MDALPIDGDVAMPNAEIALAAHNSTSKADVHTWHHQLGHLHIDAVLAMVKKGMVKGMEIVGSHSPPNTCEPCLKGKQTRAEIYKSTDSPSHTLPTFLAESSLMSVGNSPHAHTTVSSIS
jgi:hypothetical protein